MAMTEKRLAKQLAHFQGGRDGIYAARVSSYLMSPNHRTFSHPITCADYERAAGEVSRHVKNLAHRRALEKKAGRKPPKWMTEDARGGRAVVHSLRKLAQKCRRG